METKNLDREIALMELEDLTAEAAEIFQIIHPNSRNGGCPTPHGMDISFNEDHHAECLVVKWWEKYSA
jgi:hypothetical protein